MRVAIGSDHGGFELKNELLAYFKAEGIEFKDFGSFSCEAVDYSDIAEPVALAVLKGECDTGVLICGTGIGISIAANKIPGVRCAHCHDVFSAKATRLHNDANLLAMGGRVIGPEHAKEVVAAFLCTPFSNEERHKRRIEKIHEIERKYMKEGL